MNLRKISALVCVLVLCLMCTSCTSEDIQLAETVISSSAPLINLIPDQKVDSDAQQIADYSEAGLNIAETLLSNWTPAGWATAVSQFNMLVLPTLSASSSPQTQQVLTSFAAAIQNLIARAPSATTAHVLSVPGVHALVDIAAPAKLKPLSDKDKTKLKAKITAAKERLKQAKAKKGLK